MPFCAVGQDAPPRSQNWPQIRDAGLSPPGLGSSNLDSPFLGPATTQNLVVKFDGEICGGVLVEYASDDFPQQKLENLLPNFAGSSPPISPKTSPTSLWKSLVLTFCPPPPLPESCGERILLRPSGNIQRIFCSRNFFPPHLLQIKGRKLVNIFAKLFAHVIEKFR